MKVIYQHPPPVEIAGRKLVGNVLYGLLILLSAAVGAAADCCSCIRPTCLKSSNSNVIVPVP